MNLLERASAYTNGGRVLADWIGNGGIAVDKLVAQERTTVCLTCVHNQPGWPLTETVASAIKEQVELKNALELRVAGERGLHTCSICECPLKLKIWLPIEAVTKYQNGDAIRKFPAHCWIRKESGI